SGVSSHSGEHGTTYGIEVLYRYQFDGKKYASSKYGFMNSNSSNYYGKLDIVHTLPAEMKTVCFVDPNDPAYAVLDRSYSTIIWLSLIPLVLAIIGAAGLAGVFRSNPATSPTVIPGLMMGTVPAAVKPMTPIRALLVALATAAFWNGIVSVFVNELVVEWQHGQHDYSLSACSSFRSW
ncbi:MAG: DUF3592 domain-containing protein, partial [Phycisphaerae bacterium]|nr:DUF3592 domain-containing protein [Phycisphaerae bacterium]